MGKSKKKSSKPSRSFMSSRAQNAFDIAEDENESVRGTRNQRFDMPEGSGHEDDERKDYSTGAVAPENDEEIDSDEAMGSEDEYEMLSRTNRHQSDKGGEEQDEQEEQEGYTSIDESELVPLSEVWDLDDKDAAENESDSENRHIKLDDENSQSTEDGDDSEDEGSQDESESELSFSEDSDSELDEEKMSSLRKMIAGMADETTPSESTKRKRLEINNIQEGEFALPTGGQKLSLEDLTAGVSGGSSLTLLHDMKSTKSKTLGVPLPSRIQQRHDRKAAYELSKQEVDKWSATVKTNRETEHLQFPINPAPQMNKMAVHAPIEPSTDLEKKVQGILAASSLADEKAAASFEELAPTKLSMEEVKKRRNELRMMRELMFREEQKAKRIKKIKSKSYHKVHKKEREKEMLLVEGSDEDNESHDIQRARERMSLRHKNTGKWAKRMVEQGFTKDRETRSEMEEMLRRGESLRKKILGGDDVADDGEEDDDQFLARVENDDDESDVDEQKESLGKGVLGMKFMRDAEAREKKLNEFRVDELRNAKNVTGFEELDEAQGETGVNEVLNAGRRKFTPGTGESRTELVDRLREARNDQDMDEERSVSSKLKKSFDRLERLDVVDDDEGEQQTPKSKSPARNEAEVEENPWLTSGGDQLKRKAKSFVSIDRNSTTKEKKQDKIRKQKSSSKSENAQEHDGAIDMNQRLEIVDPLGSDAEASDHENDSMMVTKKNANGITFKQQDLVKRAFAGDDVVVTEFQEEKRRKIEEEGDQEIDETLPGWGSWGGATIKTTKKFVRKVGGIKADKRQDAKLKNVIINEKVNKKNAKYQATNVPFPFETREQYERSLRMPIGREWTSKDTFQKLTKPHVIVKQGTVIDPIKAPFK
jgi:U3 small nucleolar RNA-associated protein 14